MNPTLIVGIALCFMTFIGGYKVSDWKHDSEKRHEEQIRRTIEDAEIERIRAVSVAYQSVLSELQRIRTGIRTETFHETQKIEYRCIIPESGQLLINSAIDAANQAITGSVGAMRVGGEAPDKGSGGPDAIHN